MKHLWLLIFVLALLLGLDPSRADGRADGLKAYDSRDYPRAHELLLPYAERGDAEAALRLGILCRDGLGGGVDQDAAFRWFLVAGKSDDAALVREAGKALDKMKDYEAGMIHVVRLLKDAASEGDAEALHIIGKAFLFGSEYKEYNFARIHPANPPVGVNVLRHAVDKDYAPAIATLAFAYFRGLGVEKDEAKAIELATKGAERGDPDSQFELIGCYHLAAPPLKDDMKAVTWGLIVYYSLPKGSSLGESALEQALAPGNQLSDTEIEAAKAKARAWISEHAKLRKAPRPPAEAQ